MSELRNQPTKQGDATFGVCNLEKGCDNCGVVAEFGMKYKPAHKPEKELDLCHECCVGFVVCVNQAGLLG